MIDTVTDNLAGALRRHAEAFPDEPAAGAFLQFLASDQRVFERDHVPGHFTGSAWLVSADGERVLLTRHRKLRRWLQLGGHADGDHDLVRVALREAEEESGLGGLAIDPMIFDLDCHLIPASGIEPAHLHYDVRYVVRAAGSEAFVVSSESLELAWWPIGALAQDPAADASLRRMARRWLSHRPQEGC